MAEEGGGGGTSIWFIVFLLVGIIAVWILSGAAKNADLSTIFFSLPGTTNPFASTSVAIIEAPSVAGVAGGGSFDPIETDEITSEVAAVRNELERIQGYPTSPFAGTVVIEAANSGRTRGAQGEYIVLRASTKNTAPVVITGWKVESAVSKKVAVIGTGIDTYLPGGVGVMSAIVLNPGDEAIVSTTRSPVGASFRVNICSGYLSQFQQFMPSLSTNCPLPEDEALDSGSTLAYNDSACIAHLSSIPSCSIDLNPPDNLTDACKAFIYNTITYQGCADIHKNDSNFRSKQWRVFLGYDTGLWRENREVLGLLDSQGKLVDSTTY